MKLTDLISPKPGTYVALKVAAESEKLLRDFAKENSITITEDNLHTTVIYSKKHCENFELDTNQGHIAYPTGYALFGDKHEKILVILLNAPSIVARHLQLMAKHSATYSYPVYQPHITLASNFTGDVNTIPPIDFLISFDKEYTEDLQDD